MSEAGQLQTPARLNVSQAAKAIGKARSTLNRDIANGKVSVTRNGTGQPYIDIAELERVYGSVDIRTLTEPVQIGQLGTPKTTIRTVPWSRKLSFFVSGWPTRTT
jgi:hypothetical protein